MALATALGKLKLNRDTWRGFVQLLGYLSPYKVKFSIALTTLFLTSFLSLSFPYLMGGILDAALPFRKSSGEVPPMGDLNSVALLLLCVLGIHAALAYFQTIVFAEVGQQTLADLRTAT